MRWVRVREGKGREVISGRGIKRGIEVRELREGTLGLREETDLRELTEGKE